MFIDVPSKPKVKTGEFPFELVYEYKGEQVTITDTIVCEYAGYSFSLEAEAQAIDNAIMDVLDQGYRTGDIYSEGMKLVGTKEMGDLIVEALK